MSELGLYPAGGTAGSTNPNYWWAVGPFTMPTDGSTNTINIWNPVSGSQSGRVAIFEDNGSDYPGDLVATATFDGVYGASTWISVPISAVLSSGSKYWLGWVSSGGIVTTYTSGGVTKYISYGASNPTPDPFPPSASSVSRTYSIYVDYTPGASNSITITTPVQYTPSYANGSTGFIEIAGVYAGSPVAIEARFNGGPWQTIDASPGAGMFSGTLTEQSVGYGSLDVRWTNDTSVTGSVADIICGDIFLIAGQSNHAGRLTNLQTCSPVNGMKAFGYKTLGTTIGQWTEITDPTGDTTKGSIWPIFAEEYMTKTGRPCAFIFTSQGSTGLVGESWTKPGLNYTNSVNAVLESGVSGLTAILWHQGENESQSGTVTQTQYQTALAQFLDDFQYDTGLSVKMGVGQLLTYTSASSRESHDAIRAAQSYLWDNDTDCFNGPVLCDLSGDGTHIVTDAEALIFAQRWTHFVRSFTGDSSEGRGPTISSISQISDTVIRVVFTVANPPLQNATDTTGWRVVDDTGILTISSCAAYGTTGVNITVSRTLDTNPLVSWASFNDASGSTITDTSTYDLPPEPFFNVASEVSLPITVNDTSVFADAQGFPLACVETAETIDMTGLIHALSTVLSAIIGNSMLDAAMLAQAGVVILAAGETAIANGHGSMTDVQPVVLASCDHASTVDCSVCVASQCLALAAFETLVLTDHAALTPVNALILTVAMATDHNINAVFGTPVLVPVLSGSPMLQITPLIIRS